MKAIHKAQLSGKKRGQVLVLFVLALVVLILFLGTSIDLGFAYLTRANLSKAMDSAALTGALNLGQGTAVATSLATNMFYVNYRSSGRDVSVPIPTVTFTTDTQGNRYINIGASAQIRTFFIGILPQWKTLTVSPSVAQGTRARAIITLVLDKSGSMSGNGGADKMRDAITNSFLRYFDDARDEVALVTFANIASVDVQMPTSIPPQPFKSQITARVKAIYPTAGVGGDTFSQHGLTNALVQIARAPVNPGENVLRAVVFFTDGFANVIQDTLSCPTPTLYNFGGNAPSEPCYISFYDPSTGNEICQKNDGCNPNQAVTMSGCTKSWWPNPCSATKFFSQATQTSNVFTRVNICLDAEYRSIQVANEMRANPTNPVIVYSIGLATSSSSVNVDFLKKVANDPTLTGHVATPYDGVTVIAPSSAQLGAAFQLIARKIALRLTR
jgi:Flp pilus assembly protein TadG